MHATLGWDGELTHWPGWGRADSRLASRKVLKVIAPLKARPGGSATQVASAASKE